MANIHIIGSGLAGLAAATTLVRAGRYVQLYEASSHAGGRCALLRDEHRNDGYDGCNALLFSGNQLLKRYAGQLGSAHTLIPLDRGGQMYDVKRRAAVTRASFLLPPALPMVDALQLMRMRFSGRGYAADDFFGYYHPLREEYIEPLCRGLSLSDASQADAQRTAQRAWGIMRHGSSALRLMVPKHSLYQSLIEPALRQLENEGSSIYYSHALKKIALKDGAIHALHFAKQVKEIKPADKVILALPAQALTSLAPGALPAKLSYQDIVQVHFHLSEDTASKIVPLIGGSFDWARLHQQVATVVSYVPEALLNMHDDFIAERAWREAKAALGLMAEELPAFRVVRSRRAHSALAPGKITPFRYHSNGFLAGELFAPGNLIPIEASIASGIQAAEAVLAA